MARYNIGDKVKTTDAWDNGMGKVIPKGSIVEIKYDNGKMCRCSIQGQEAWYEYEWLGDVVKNGIIGSKITNEEILKKLKDRKSSWEKLLTKNSNNVIDVDLEIGIRINELDEVIKLFE